VQVDLIGKLGMVVSALASALLIVAFVLGSKTADGRNPHAARTASARVPHSTTKREATKRVPKGVETLTYTLPETTPASTGGAREPAEQFSGQVVDDIGASSSSAGPSRSEVQDAERAGYPPDELDQYEATKDQFCAELASGQTSGQYSDAELQAVAGVNC
jgi:hypothetical protein